MVFCGVLNAVVERVAYRPLRRAPRLAPLITAIAMSFILQNVAHRLEGPELRLAAVGILPHGDVFNDRPQHLHLGRR